MSFRIRALLIVMFGVAAMLLPSAAWAQATRLNATVGPGFTISLRDASGANVTRIPAGAYQIVVNDQGIEHNFHLTGPGVDMRTEVEQTGTVTWNVNLTDGIYTFLCDPHASTMRGQFAVGTAQLPPPPPPPSPPAPPRVRTLTASVGPGATISLKLGGRKVTRLRAGRYRIVVRDRSRAHNFHLVGPGLNRKTSVGANATATWTVTLRRGTYRYVSDPKKAAVKGSFRVT